MLYHSTMRKSLSEVQVSTRSSSHPPCFKDPGILSNFDFRFRKSAVFPVFEKERVEKLFWGMTRCSWVRLGRGVHQLLFLAVEIPAGVTMSGWSAVELGTSQKEPEDGRFNMLSLTLRCGRKLSRENVAHLLAWVRALCSVPAEQPRGPIPEPVSHHFPPLSCPVQSL